MKQKRITDLTIYRKTIGFVLKRVKFLFLAGLILLFLCCIQAVLTILFPGFMGKIGWLAGILNALFTFLAVNAVAARNKRRYWLGHISMITEAEQNNRLPEDPFREGLKRADERFGNADVFKVLKNTLTALVGLFVKKEMNAEQRK